MNRRTYIKTAGALSALGAVGCLERAGSGAVNEFGYEVKELGETEVPMVPLEDAVEWHEAEDAVFVDTRAEIDFIVKHIEGALHSPAPDGKAEDDPVGALDTETRIVTYGDGAVRRGASLIEEGYRYTYALSDRFEAWNDAEYPVGSDCSCDHGT